MKRTFLYLLCVIFTFVSPSASAQDETPVIIKSKLIKMAKYPIADLPKKSPVSDIRIVQFVRDSINLGYVLKGLYNQVATISPSKPLTEFLQVAIDKMYKDDYKPAGVKLLFVLKDLRITERTAFTEFSYLRFNADAYTLTGINTYNYVSKVDTVFFSESGGDVSDSHGQEIESSIKLLLHQTLKQIKISPEQPSMTLEKIRSDATVVTNFPISTDNFKDGEYISFNDFLQNTPSTVFYDSIVLHKTKLTFVRTNDKNPQDSIAIWGLCKNGQVYKFHQGELIELEREGGGFVLSNFAERLNKKHSDMFAGALVGGIAGALIVGGSRKYKPYLVTSIPHLSKPKKQPWASVIDMETGELSF